MCHALLSSRMWNREIFFHFHLTIALSTRSSFSEWKITAGNLGNATRRHFREIFSPSLWRIVKGAPPPFRWGSSFYCLLPGRTNKKDGSALRPRIKETGRWCLWLVKWEIGIYASDEEFFFLHFSNIFFAHGLIQNIKAGCVHAQRFPAGTREKKCVKDGSLWSIKEQMTTVFF